MTRIKMNFRLKNAIESSNFTQMSLASFVKLPQSYISMACHNRINLEIEQKQSIARALKKEVRELFDD